MPSRLLLSFQTPEVQSSTKDRPVLAPLWSLTPWKLASAVLLVPPVPDTAEGGEPLFQLHRHLQPRPRCIGLCGTISMSVWSDQHKKEASLGAFHGLLGLASCFPSSSVKRFPVSIRIFITIDNQRLVPLGCPRSADLVLPLKRSPAWCLLPNETQPALLQSFWKLLPVEKHA